MKKLCMVMVVIAFVSFMALPVAFGYPVYQGDTIEKVGGDGPNGGGEFIIRDITTNYYFKTFCLERTETILNYQDVIIESISNAAVHGGIAGGNPDYLSGQTAYLFYNFWYGTLTGYTHNKQGDLQIAIWMLEGELFDGDGTGLWNVNNEYYKLALSSNWTGIGPVRVINPVIYGATGAIAEYKQSLLVVTPEPGTLLILGLGLMGVAAIRRKM